MKWSAIATILVTIFATACGVATTPMPTPPSGPVATTVPTPGKLSVLPTPESDRLAKASWMDIPSVGKVIFNQTGLYRFDTYASGEVVYVSVYKGGAWVTNLGVDPLTGGLRAGQAIGLFSWDIKSFPGDTAVLSLVGQSWALAIRLKDGKYQGAFFPVW